MSHYITKQGGGQSANPAPEKGRDGIIPINEMQGRYLVPDSEFRQAATFMRLFGKADQPSTGWASTQTRRSMMKAPVISLRQTPLRLLVPNFTTGTNSSYI